ncbi:hypothetical protein NT07LI_1602 [Listeria innocua FSL S4-378]|nr:hypothetical protein NT07LI_1602 [Listeria innocua FSL S4-378]
MVLKKKFPKSKKDDRFQKKKSFNWLFLFSFYRMLLAVYSQFIRVFDIVLNI